MLMGPFLSMLRSQQAGDGTYELEHVPIEHVVVGKALAMEQVPEELPQVRVVRLVVKTQGTAEVQVRGKLSCETTRHSGLSSSWQQVTSRFPTLIPTWGPHGAAPQLWEKSKKRQHHRAAWLPLGTCPRAAPQNKGKHPALGLQMMLKEPGGTALCPPTPPPARPPGALQALALTRVALAQHFDGRGHLLLADALVLLPLGGSLQPLPGQGAQVEVHEHIAQ